MRKPRKLTNTQKRLMLLEAKVDLLVSGIGLLLDNAVSSQCPTKDDLSKKGLVKNKLRKYEFCS